MASFPPHTLLAEFPFHVMHQSDPNPSPRDAAASPRWRRVLARLGVDTRRSRSVVSAGRVDHVIDPDGTVLLFRVSGAVAPCTIDEIARRTVSLDARHTVHLDLHDACIPSVQVVDALERLADRLERSRVRIRMVGLDPNHPAIDARP